MDATYDKLLIPTYRSCCIEHLLCRLTCSLLPAPVNFILKLDSESGALEGITEAELMKLVVAWVSGEELAAEAWREERGDYTKKKVK